MRCSFSENPDLDGTLFDLLETVFPGLRRAAAEAARLGASWQSVSTPFVSFEAGRPVAHVGLIDLPLVLLGRDVHVGSVHAVATHPERRRRGHYRTVMQELLEHCTGRYDTLVLSTEHPEYFEPFGFRHVREHRFSVRAHGSAGREGLRRIDVHRDEDVALVNRLLERREPVSRVVGVRREKAIFWFNERHRSLYHVPDLDVLLCMEVHGDRLGLFDVVGSRIPTLEELLSRIPRSIRRVEIFVAPDRLAPGTAAEPHLLDHDGPSYLMVRGTFEPENEPFMLPRSART